MEALRTWLKTTGTSQVELARQMEVSQPTVWAWVHGEADPSRENLRKLSRITELSVEALIAEDGVDGVDGDAGLDQTTRARA